MAKIKVLPAHEALKIAAGEVIERPAHILKELVENSLDAGALHISVYIDNVGKDLIRVVDDGCGMTADDAKLCFLSHATSKISGLDDLEHIVTFGFRGEALASVAAISNVILITKPRESASDDLGVRLECSQGVIAAESPCACPVGTDIQVRDLFFNTPVRKKFLKRDETEWNAIVGVVHAFCFTYPHVHFKLYTHDKCVLNVPPVTTAKERALQLWEHEVANSLMPLRTQDAQQSSVAIHGFISHHNFWRYGRNYLYFFVNNRWIKNADIGKAVLKGYLNVLPPGRFPAALVFISVASTDVDVNIHPKKEEVKFIKPGVVANELTTLVKQTLEAHLSSVLQRSHPADVLSSALPEPVLSSPRPDSFYGHQEFTVPARQFSTTPVWQETIATPLASSVPQQHVAAIPEPSATILGQLFKTYIIIEKDDSVVFVDQHAAHERILYEQFKQRFEQQHGSRLLFPEIIKLLPDDLTHLLSIKESFAVQGVELDQMGSGELVIRSAPPGLKHTSLRELIMEVVHYMHENDDQSVDAFTRNVNEYIHAQMACKRAVKAGDALTIDQMRKLIADLDSVENRFICVHGRPTTWSVAKSEMEKRFKRI